MTARANRRQVLAFIALADAPAPTEIRFRTDGVSFTFELDRIADITTWARLFGVSDDNLAHTLGGDSTFVERETGRLMRMVTLYPDWQGWHIYMSATEYADVVGEPLDDSTRADLAMVASEAGAPC